MIVAYNHNGSVNKSTTKGKNEMKHPDTREIATDNDLWDEYIDPTGEGGNDFETMSIYRKMRMIVELWPEDVDENDDEGQAILAEIRGGK
jgi:hypothetical protein